MPLPNVIIPGYFAGAEDYRQLEGFLNDAGLPTVTVPISRGNWWPTFGGRSMVPILRRIHETVSETLNKYQVSKINLIGHSAGGWIARIYLGEIPYTIHGDVTEEAVGLWGAHPSIATLVTLGTPHISQEYWTRKNLNFVKDNYPGAFYPGVRYVCMAGKAVYGERFRRWLSFNSYKLTVGKGDCWGDGITPIEAAHLEGAENLVLDGVWHSPKSPGSWYSSPDVWPSWASYLQ